jgi:hypothetical protein
LNSSIMWWDTRYYRHIWDTFSQQDLAMTMKKYHGDQDYISAVIPQNQRRFFDQNQVQSWRWQCLDGGYNFQKRRYYSAGSGTAISDSVSVMVFHGNPKPSTITDPAVIAHWK